MMRHASATTAIVVTTGRNAAVRTSHRWRACPSVSSASTNPSRSDPAVVPTASTTVCQIAFVKFGLVATSW